MFRVKIRKHAYERAAERGIDIRKVWRAIKPTTRFERAKFGNVKVVVDGVTAILDVTSEPGVARIMTVY